MMSEHHGARIPRPRIEEVRAEIADLQRRIHAAGEPSSEEFLHALLAYEPCLQRRFRLLAELTETTRR